MTKEATFRLLSLSISLVIVSTMALTHIKAGKIKTWAKTKGTIEYIYSQYASSPTVAGAEDKGKKKTFIKYRYKVQGVDYSGKTVILLEYIYFPEILLAKLSHGEVTIYFNPEAPHQSIISTQYPYVSMIMLSLSAAALLSISLWFNKIKNFFYTFLITLKL